MYANVKLCPSRFLVEFEQLWLRSGIVKDYPTLETIISLLCHLSYAFPLRTYPYALMYEKLHECMNYTTKLTSQLAQLSCVVS